jgi:hypothetical protein
MGVRLAATTPTAGDDAPARILIAIELSKKSFPAPQHGLPPGVAGVVVGKGDSLVLGIGDGRAGGEADSDRY